MKLGTFNHLSPSSPIFSSFPPLLELFLIRFEEQFPSAEATSGRHRLRQRCESLTIPSSNQNGFVPRIFFESRRFNLSNNDGVIARAAFVCPWRSPSKPVLPSQRIRLPRLRKPDSNSSNRNRLVPLLFLKSPQINLSSGEAVTSCHRPCRRHGSPTPPFTTHYSLLSTHYSPPSPS